MKTTIREFQRNFRAMREKAKAGERVVVQDAGGVAYSFVAEKPKSFGDAAADIAGSFRSDVGDLASNPEHLSGYGGR